MAALADKAQLLEQMEAARARWDAVLARIGSSRLEEPGVEGVWSVKQVVAHVLGYEEWTLAFLADLNGASASAQSAFDSFWQTQLNLYRQEHPDLPASLEETDDDQTNAVVVASFDGVPAVEVLERERRVYGALLAALKHLSEARLLEPWRPGGPPLIAILPAQSSAHYEMHLPAIEQWLGHREQ